MNPAFVAPVLFAMKLDKYYLKLIFKEFSSMFLICRHLSQYLYVASSYLEPNRALNLMLFLGSLIINSTWSLSSSIRLFCSFSFFFFFFDYSKPKLKICWLIIYFVSESEIMQVVFYLECMLDPQQQSLFVASLKLVVWLIKPRIIRLL